MQEQEEVIKELKSIRRCKCPKNEDDILKWNSSQLSAYIISNTKGMNLKQKVKFAEDLRKRISDAKSS